MARITRTIDAYPQKIRLAVFDHIVSKPAVVMPIKKISEIFKSRSIAFFVDGAHALGQVPINL